MNLHSARLYAYLFFEVSNEAPALSFFDQQIKDYHLKQGEVFDVGDPDVIMLRLAEKQGLAVCILRWHDIDIVEIEWNQDAPDTLPFEFWKQTTDQLEEMLATISCLGICRAYFAHADDLSQNTVKKITRFCNWKISPEYPLAEILSLGNLYSIEPQKYLLLSHDDKDPAAFLGRDFPIMASFIQKLDIEYKERESIEAQNTESKKQIDKLMAEKNLKGTEKRLIDIEAHYEKLRYNTGELGKLKQTLDINLLNLENYLETYEMPHHTLFTPTLRKADYVRRQLEYDLNYLRLTIEGISANLRLLGLKIENKRIKGQQRIERWIATIGITIGVGQIAANVPSVYGIPQWLVQLGIMIIFALVIFLLLWVLGILDTEKDE